MYTLKRKLGQKVFLKTSDGDIEIIALESNKANVRFGIKAPSHVLITREEEVSRRERGGK